MRQAKDIEAGKADPVAQSGSTVADALSILVTVATVAVIFWLSDQRTIAGYGTEHDFIGSMVGEAERLLNGLPLESKFHPPGFTFVLAATYLGVGDWFETGKAISIFSAAATLVSAHLFFRLLGGPWLALGAVVGLVSSATFLKFGMQATSDIYGLALFYVAFLLAAFAAVRQSVLLWFAVGLVIVLSVMTRTNGLTQIFLLGIPLLQVGLGYKLRAILGCVTGIIVAAFGFYVFATMTGSNLRPDGTYHNLALTYFTEERVSWEGMIESRSRFSSLYEVLTHDPVAMAKGYIRDLLDIALVRIPQLSGPVLALLFLPGIILAVADRHRLLLLGFFAITLAQLALVNFKAYEPRYHMYLTPWIGAGAVYLLWAFSRRGDVFPLLRNGILALGAAGILLGIAYAGRDAQRFASFGGNPEMSRVLPEVSGIVAAGDLVVARKGHLAFYNGAETVYLADVTTEPEFRAVFEEAKVPTDGTLYLFVGEVERSKRPQIAAIVDDGLPWLATVAEGDGWALYRYAPEG
ncbi:MAG: hypothetical protein NXH97_03660 [Rhodobacteraceae bacterium]|nr:hypothetical protein [Paracoccaceae bacterium]